MFRFEGGFIAIVIGEFNLNGAVVKQFGGTFAGDLVAFVAAVPGKVDG